MNTAVDSEASAFDIAGAIARGDASAVDVVSASLARIAERNPLVNAFTDIVAQRALEQARVIDGMRARNDSLPPLAGVPYAVKNLFDLQGVVTRAGSRINRDNVPASRDAFAVRALTAAGAVCVGTLNMGEYAYDFTGENAHDGDCRNPHDLTRMSGGSSSGPAAAVAAGLVPAALGSDTNGSIRVPASWCGLFGLKPTFGRLSRAGTFPFCASLDHVGPMARSARDLALFYDAMAGHDAQDPVQVRRSQPPVAAQLDPSVQRLRVRTAGGYFRERASRQALAALDTVAQALMTKGVIELPEAARARAAAFVITAGESAALHLPRLRSRAADFDPNMRDRLLAGAMMPAGWLVQAQRFRRWYIGQVRKAMAGTDILLAPATPTTAFELGQKEVMLDGRTLPARQAIGPYTQPISFAGLPVVTVPVWLPDAALPIGVQLIGLPWQEGRLLKAAWQLEQQGVCRAPVAQFR